MTLEVKVQKGIKWINGREVPSQPPLLLLHFSTDFWTYTSVQMRQARLDDLSSFIFVHIPWINRQFINLKEKQEATGHWIGKTLCHAHL